MEAQMALTPEDRAMVATLLAPPIPRQARMDGIRAALGRPLVAVTAAIALMREVDQHAFEIVCNQALRLHAKLSAGIREFFSIQSLLLNMPC